MIISGEMSRKHANTRFLAKESVWRVLQIMRFHQDKLFKQWLPQKTIRVIS